jgi:branched-chain amino acid transport system ATP-binding protein
MLSVQGLTSGYGDLMVLRDISIDVKEREFVAIVGSNAAGKSTLMRSIAGLLPLRSGQITFEGQRIDRLPTNAIADRGLSMVFEHSALPGMNVEDNLVMGAYRRAARPHLRATLTDVYALFPILAERRRQMAVSLSGGQQQMLVIGRALMSRPRILALDEPSVGLAPAMVSTILKALRQLNAQGLTMLLVEQNVAQTLKVATRGYVIEGGAVVLQGAAAELLNNPAVKSAYLGI